MTSVGHWDRLTEDSMRIESWIRSRIMTAPDFIDMEEPFKITLTFPEDFEPITYEFARKIFELVALFDKKQKDYGKSNISEFGRTGVLIRMNDKLARVKNIVMMKSENGNDAFLFGAKDKNMQPLNESLRDSYKDIAVYAVIDWLLEDGLWK